jgi:hypothetical protein
VSDVFKEINRIFDEAAPQAGGRLRRMPVGKCNYCDQHGDNQMMPPHQPSRNCESGKHNHCTCDVCF